MIGDAVVVDGVIHGYNLVEGNRQDGIVPMIVAEALYAGVHCGFSPAGEPKWVLPKERFFAGNDAELVGNAIFKESNTDAIVYHGVPLYGFYKDGSSPLDVGKALREQYPGRVMLYGPISPWAPDALEEVDRLVEEEGVQGIKLYPQDLVDGELRDWSMSDPEKAFPILQRAQERGIKSVAIHKAIPLGPVPVAPFRVDDIEGAAIAFPELTIEVVHGGFAFLEDTVMQLMRFMNVAVNLEGGSLFLLRAPRRFAELLGAMLVAGAEDRIFWATGNIAVHPQPFIEAFWNLEMPRDLVEGFGYPELTPEIKKKILGANLLRVHGWELPEGTAGGDSTLAEPWSAA